MTRHTLTLAIAAAFTAFAAPDTHAQFQVRPYCPTGGNPLGQTFGLQPNTLPGQNLGQGQIPGQGQGYGQGQNLGQGLGYGQAPDYGQGQSYVQGQGVGQGQNLGQGQDNGQGQVFDQVPQAGAVGQSPVAIVNAVGNLVLDAEMFHVQNNDCRIQIWQDFGLPNQRWTMDVEQIDANGNEIVAIRNASSNLVLAADLLHVNQNDCRLQLWQDLNLPNQRWRKVSLGGDRYKFYNVASGKVLAVHLPDARRVGGRTQLWDDLPGFENQVWTIHQ